MRAIATVPCQRPVSATHIRGGPPPQKQLGTGARERYGTRVCGKHKQRLSKNTHPDRAPQVAAKFGSLCARPVSHGPCDGRQMYGP